jgi:hypothetical protein
MKDTLTHPQQESVAMEHKHLLCWKSSLAGLLISFMAFVALSALGAGIAGFTAESLIEKQEGAFALATGAGLYLGLAVVISLFCGTYFSLRISRFVTTKVGAAHGFVIASAFFLFMLVGLGNVVGGLAVGFANLAKSAGTGVSDMVNQPRVQDVLNQAMGTATLKADPKEVAHGLASRWMQGDSESAVNYLAYQTGQSRADVEAKMTDLKNQFDSAAKAAAEKAARAVGDTGASLFVLILVGLIAAVVGGRVGAHANVERPFATSSNISNTSLGFSTLGTQHGSMVPYLFGWLLGVPVSILILIAMVRAVF